MQRSKALRSERAASTSKRNARQDKGKHGFLIAAEEDLKLRQTVPVNL